jgi:hypothetical protein
MRAGHPVGFVPDRDPASSSRMVHGGSWPRVCHVLLVHSNCDTDLARRLATDLETALYRVNVGEFGTDTNDPETWPRRPVTVAILPSRRRTKDYATASAHIVRLAADGWSPVVIADEGTVPTEGLRQLIRRTGRTYDAVFQDVLRELANPPHPSWQLRARPANLSRPAGVSWWGDEMFVTDDESGRLVRVDRDKIVLANKGGNEILVGALANGAVRHLRAIDHAGRKPFRSPAGVAAGFGRTVVADTDNHRVVVTESDLWADGKRRPQWRTLEPPGPFAYPCGAHVTSKYIAIADTFNHRIVVFGHDGNFAGVVDGMAMAMQYPTSVTSWRDVLVVTEEDGRRVGLFSVRPGRKGLRVTRIGELGTGVFVTPFAASVNRYGQLAVSDRARACIWVVDLPAYLAEIRT